MVQIATSRDVGFASTRSGRSAPSGQTVDVGAALSNAGKGMQQAAYDLDELRATETKDNFAKTGYDLETKLTQFRAQEEENFNKAQAESSESGIGFTRQHLEAYQKRTDDFIKANFAGVNEAQNAAARQSLLGLGNSIYTKAYDYEQKAKTNFYDRTTNQGLDTVRTQIRSNAAPYEELKSQGLAAIDKADMPEPWKAERRAMWDADAAESKWRWKFEQDPKTAITDLQPSTAKSVLRHEEGFRAEPYWDVNAWRIGYGSDTVTLADGSHVPVTKGMKITKEDAERDLTYRLTEREGAQARKQVGEQWDTLPGNVQGALASVAYNYGSLPSSVVTAVKGGDTEAIAAAVEALDSNPKRREREAAIIRGTATAPGEDEFAAIPYDRREALMQEGQTALNQQVNKERTAAKDRYSLLIAAQPSNVTSAMIVNDPRLDDGDKATLVTSLNTAMKERGATDALITAMTTGKVSVNQFDSDQTKAADGAYDKLLGAATTPQEQSAVTSDFVDRTGYVPKKVQAELRRGASGTDPSMMAQSLEAAMTLSLMAPGGLSFEGSADLVKKMDVYRAFTRDMGYSPEEAAKRIVDSNNPEKAAQRSALIKSEPVVKLLKDVDAGTVASIFDDGWLSPAPSLGANPGAGAVMVADYKSLLEESIVDAGGDLDAAKKAANARFARVYGKSEFTTLGNAVIRNPVELSYPAGPDGTHEWVRTQAVDALTEYMSANNKRSGEGVGFTIGEVFLMPMPDGGTAKDVQAGRPARYQIFYTDKDRGTIEALNVPFYADAEAEKAKAKADLDARMSTSEGIMIDRRAGALAQQSEVDAVRAARDAAAEKYKDYGAPFRDQMVKEAERTALEGAATAPAAPAKPAPNQNKARSVKIGGNSIGSN